MSSLGACATLLILQCCHSYDNYSTWLNCPSIKGGFGVCHIFRQFESAFEDLREAVKLAPTNRELQRLLIRVKDECQEQAMLEGHGASKRAEETAL